MRHRKALCKNLSRSLTELGLSRTPIAIFGLVVIQGLIDAEGPKMEPIVEANQRPRARREATLAASSKQSLGAGKRLLADPIFTPQERATYSKPQNMSRTQLNLLSLSACRKGLVRGCG